MSYTGLLKSSPLLCALHFYPLWGDVWTAEGLSLECHSLAAPNSWAKLSLKPSSNLTTASWAICKLCQKHLEKRTYRTDVGKAPDSCPLLPVDLRLTFSCSNFYANVTLLLVFPSQTPAWDVVCQSSSVSADQNTKTQWNWFVFASPLAWRACRDFSGIIQLHCCLLCTCKHEHSLSAFQIWINICVW